MNKYIFTAVILSLLTLSCRNDSFTARLKSDLDAYISSKDANIGVAVVFDGNDTIIVNGESDFPMLSVYKFPQALAVADYCIANGISLSDTIAIDFRELKEDTYSPLRDRYGISNLRLPINELLSYSLQQSDNNACDILFRIIGGPDTVDRFLKGKGLKDIHVRSTEDEMHQDLTLCYDNSSTPLEMLKLIELFDNGMRDEHGIYSEIALLMETCRTGTDRILQPMINTDVVVGHKTGTGDRNQNDRIIAVNDVGYVHLPDGRKYSIAIFVSDSNYGMSESSAIIAEISDMVYRSYNGK